MSHLYSGRPEDHQTARARSGSHLMRWNHRLATTIMDPRQRRVDADRAATFVLAFGDQESARAYFEQALEVCERLRYRPEAAVVPPGAGGATARRSAARCAVGGHDASGPRSR